MEIEVYDEVLLTDGRIVTVLEVYEKYVSYEIEVLVDDTGKYPEFETETIKYEDIKGVIKEPIRKVL